MANPTLEQFEVAVRASIEAFNHADFATAFAGLPPDCQWYPFEESTERSPLVGPEEVSQLFGRVFDSFPDWHVELVRIFQAGDGVLRSSSALQAGAARAGRR